MRDQMETMRVALVHDYWVNVRGGERIFLAFMRMFPQADAYVLVQRRESLTALPEGRRLRASIMQRIPLAARYYRALLPLYPWAARSLDLRGYDLVLSSSSGFCHAAQTDGPHLCYCHSPLRYAWHEYDETLAAQRFPPARAALASVLDHVRQVDYAAAQRVGVYIANSRTTQARIKTFYGRDSDIVHPFVDTRRFVPAPPEKSPSASTDGYFLIVSHLLPYKRVDLAVMACTRLGRRLIVVGEGPERARLERLAGPTVKIYPRADVVTLTQLFAGCDAFLQCGREDFGMTAVEAQASGRPVLAYGADGALETVLPGVSGEYFTEQSVDALIDAIQSFDPFAYDPQAVRAHAEQFNEDHFTARMRRVITQTIASSAPSVSGALVEAERSMLGSDG